MTLTATRPRINAVVGEMAPWALGVLQRAISFQSVSGAEGPLVRDLRDVGAGVGLAADMWQGREEEIEAKFGKAPTHRALEGRPTLVLKLAGSGGGKSLIFNAHSDIVAAPNAETWRAGPWSGAVIGGAVFGRGACDTKGGLVSALWAMAALGRAGVALAGDVLLEVVPGEEDCVGLGTLTSVARGYRADGAVVMEPTGGEPRCASRAGCRFEIAATGRAAHGSVKWLGVDAIAIARDVLGALEMIERRWDVRTDDELFAGFPTVRPVTVDRINGGEWQGMVCERCAVAGYLELLPGDDIAAMKERFERELREVLGKAGRDPTSIAVAYPETYRGHRLAPSSDLCAAARRAMTDRVNGFVWSGFNAGCEAGVRAAVHGTPTLVWGPGKLEHAHATDEHVRFEDVQACAECFARLAMDWCNVKEHA